MFTKLKIKENIFMKFYGSFNALLDIEILFMKHNKKNDGKLKLFKIF